MSLNKLSAILATTTAGLTTGSLLFVSVVDARSFLSHVAKKNTTLIKNHFAVWWPFGRDLMVPLLFSGVLTNTWAYFDTGRDNFAITATLLGCIGPYTGLVLGEDIQALRKADCKEVEDTARRFCNLHHFRLVMAGVGFGFSLVALAEL